MTNYLISTDENHRLPDAEQTALATDLADSSTVVGAAVLSAPFVATKAQPTPNAFSGLKAMLDAGFSSAISIGSDSTGGGVTRWPYLFSEMLATAYPSHTVIWRPFVQGTLKWGLPIVVQSAGADRGVRLDGVTATDLVEGTAGTEFSNILGDIDLRARVAVDKWVGSASVQSFIVKFGASGSRVYRFQLNTAGGLTFDWTTDGSTLQAAFVSSVAVPFENGATGWVRVGFQVNAGGTTVATFYTSTDGVTWTVLGTPQSRAGATSLFSTTAQPIEVGGRGWSVALLAGVFYEIEIRNGIDGAITCPTRADLWRPSNSSFNGVTVGAPTIDVWDGFWSGGSLALQLVPNQALMVPAVGASVFIVNASHNEAGIDASTFALYDTFVNYAKSANTSAGIVVSTQNPKYAPSTQLYIDSQAERCAMLKSYAAQRAYTVAPVYDAFVGSSIPLSDLVSPDGTHPSDGTGSPLWADTMTTVYRAAM